MVRRGWGYGDLMAMSNQEFCFWLNLAAEALEAENKAASQ